MAKYQLENIDQWARKSTFDFFKSFDVPFYNITANVDVSNLKKFCSEKELSYVVSCLFLSEKTIQQIPHFRYRIKDNEVRLYDNTQAGCTILLENKSFAFCYFKPSNSLTEFVENGINSINELKKNPDFAPREGDLNMNFYSVIPWVSFTSFQHARRHEKDDSIPRIVFGKYFEQNGKTLMPISVEVHHSLVDGYHVGLYFEILQKEMDSLTI